MRACGPAILLACVAVVAACGRQDRGPGERIDLTQNVTSDRRPQDKVFTDFERTWRQFISPSPDLARPVAMPADPKPGAWEPQVLGECASSGDAGGLVPQVTLTWNEPLGDARAPGAESTAPVRSSPLRFDLALHHDGFGRNYYVSALAADVGQRFLLPSTSAMVKDQEAVLLTGPGLFPLLRNFTVEELQDRDSAARFAKHTLVLRDLSPGLSYTVRVDRPAPDGWSETKRFVFLTPVCPR